MNRFARFSIIISLIIITVVLVSFRYAENPVYITGHIRKNPQTTSVSVDHLLVFIKGNNKLLARTLTDSKGSFEMTFTPGKEKSFDFYCSGIGIDTLLLASMTSFESDTPELDFYIPALYKRTKTGKAICQKCKRTDKVYEIVYGDAPYVTTLISKSGDTIYSPIYKGKYYETCIVQPAKYYCKRDKLKF